MKNNNVSDMYTTEELVRHLSVQSGTLQRYIDIRRIKPDVVIKNPDKTEICYFRKERIKELCDQFGWMEINDSNIVDTFIDYCNKMTMTMSYKPVFLISFFTCMDTNGECSIEDVAKCFKSYYDDRISRGLPPEKKNCIFFRDEVYIDDVENLIIKMPFKRFSDMGFIEYSSVDGIMTLNKTIFDALDYQKIAELVVHCDETLNKYWDK